MRRKFARPFLLALALVFGTSTLTAKAGGSPDPTLLPVATTAQVPLTSAYDALGVPAIPAGGSYSDPTTHVKIYKLTSGTFPASSPRWGHDYAEGGDEVSLPYNGRPARSSCARTAVPPGGWWTSRRVPGSAILDR